MSRIEESTIVAVPVRRAYNQWTRFEDFPLFMDGVRSVDQLDDKTLHWVAQIGGVRREWTATIVEQIPDTRIVWRADEGEHHVGMVRFEPTSAGQTKVTLSMEYEPHDLAEKAADALGLIDARVIGDLLRFARFVEDRDWWETRGWRGEIRPVQRAG